ncbi:MAG: hypothetical protein ACPG52_11485 [Cognaticolwellia sp.]
MPDNLHLASNKSLSGLLMLFASIVIFAFAYAIEQLLLSYELAPMFVSFCAGFILFTPLVSLALHPLLFSKLDDNKRAPQSLMANVFLVLVVQGLFFLIWMTDAIAIYSIYVDGNGFLSKAFHIKSVNAGKFGREFYWLNLLLAWLFAFLSLVVGLLPCLIARLKNLGVVGNFVSAFKFAKNHKLVLACYAFCLAFSVVMPLMWSKYLFIIVFPAVLTWVFIAITKHYLRSMTKTLA